MSFTKETKWFCENASSLEKFSGKWVAFCVEKGVVSEGDTLDFVMKEIRRRNPAEKPFVFHVPSKDECNNPVPASHPN